MIGDDLNVEAIAHYGSRTVTRTDKDFASQFRLDGVDDDLFSILGVQAELGRTILPGDEGQPVIVVDWATYQADGAPEDYIGSMIELTDGALEVVGVMPPGFRFPRIGGTSAWTPFDGDGTIVGLPVDYANVFARLAEGQTMEGLNAELRGFAVGLAESDGSFEGMTIAAIPFEGSRLNPAPRRALWLMWAAVFLILQLPW